jgi:hypothetical protein
MMASPRALLRLALLCLLSAALLLTQQVSSSHVLQHTLAQHQQQEKSAPHAHHCDLCALDAQLGSALPHSAPVLSLASTSASAPAHHAPVALPEPTLITPARGPPAASSVYA